MLSQRSPWLNLQWVPRTENIEADAGTNIELSAFSLENRMDIVLDELPLDVMRSLVERGTAFAQDERGTAFVHEIENLKAHNKTTGRIRSRLRKRAKTAWAADV